ncbi:polysaccharide biosynthesis protein [Alkalibacterium sp. f15]|uniref:polysaccharide biosynthesis protein n=1 Tax=Alkalibacterium sp. f15 TaxID=3414029 RepID=UPI003BF81E6D
MSRNLKKLIVASFDLSTIILSAIISILFLVPFVYFPPSVIFISIGFTCITYLIVGNAFKIFSNINHRTGITEVMILVVSVSLSFILSNSFAINFVPEPLLSLRFYFLTYLFSVLSIIGSRMILRLYYEYTFRKNKEPVIEDQIRTLVVGAGNGGSIFIRSIKSFPNKLNVVAIVDDDQTIQGTFLFGVPIIGKIKDLPTIVRAKNVEQITIAIPSLPAEAYENIVDLCNQTDVIVNKMPYIEDILQGKLGSNQFRDIDVVDLLGREEVKLDMEQISTELYGKTILVSGAGGSIGSEICRQVSKFSPSKILLLGHGENSIYQIDRELRNLYNDTIEIVPLIADIQDRERIFDIMKKYKPNRVYHAAAHKHVPMMEYNPYEAVKNNVYGSKNMAEAAKAAGVDRFIMVSTDKAVNPPNVMGATKRLAEMIVTGLNEPGKTKFAAVRFGNVLGSRGSVVPLFQEQIKNGGPLTVTDFRMTRYFMTIPEASRLVIQAGTLVKGGEIFVLDMGEPVKIVDLAKKVVKLSGFTEKEIPVVETGIRPGEKLFEELLVDSEQTDQKVYDKIFVGKVVNKPLFTIMREVNTWSNLSPEELREELISFANDVNVTFENSQEQTGKNMLEKGELKLQGGYAGL